MYSLIFYIILLIGFIKIKNDKKNYKFHLLLIFLVCYLVFMLGWVGNSRYFVPSLIFLSIFFGHGIDYIKELRYKKIMKTVILAGGYGTRISEYTKKFLNQ